MSNPNDIVPLIRPLGSGDRAMTVAATSDPDTKLNSNEIESSKANYEAWSEDVTLDHVELPLPDAPTVEV